MLFPNLLVLIQLFLLTTNVNSALLRPYYSGVDEIQEALNAGVSCVEIITTFMRRIDTFNPKLRAVIQINPRIIEDAARVNFLRDAGRLKPLSCVPILVKDNIDVEGLDTSCGSLALVNNKPVTNAQVVQSFLDNGAVVIGKANMAEFADCGINSASTMGKVVRNPYDASRTAYGSSGGSAAGAASAFAVIALGTDTEGSILGPSGVTGIFGLRGTWNTVPTNGLFPAFALTDVVGPMAKHVKDIAWAWGVMNGFPTKYVEQITAPSVQASLQNVTIGIISDFLQPQRIEIDGTLIIDYNLDPSMIGILNGEFSNSIRRQGARVLQVAFSQADGLKLQSSVMRMATLKHTSGCPKLQAKSILDNYFSRTQWKSLELWVASSNFSTGFAPGAPNFREKYAKISAATGSEADECEQMLVIRQDIRSILESLMKQYGLNVMVWPAQASEPAIIQPNEFCKQDPSQERPSASLSPYSGWPSLVIPIGFSNIGMPYSIEAVTMSGQEDILIKLGYQWEVSQHSPTIIPREAPELPMNFVEYNPNFNKKQGFGPVLPDSVLSNNRDGQPWYPAAPGPSNNSGQRVNSPDNSGYGYRCQNRFCNCRPCMQAFRGYRNVGG